MFGATVLVSVLFHINPTMVLLFNGIGTLLYLFICKGKVPAYLRSSFTFVSPVLLLLGAIVAIISLEFVGIAAGKVGLLPAQG